MKLHCKKCGETKEFKKTACTGFKETNTCLVQLECPDCGDAEIATLNYRDERPCYKHSLSCDGFAK